MTNKAYMNVTNNDTFNTTESTDSDKNINIQGGRKH